MVDGCGSVAAVTWWWWRRWWLAADIVCARARGDLHDVGVYVLLETNQLEQLGIELGVPGELPACLLELVGVGVQELDERAHRDAYPLRQLGDGKPVYELNGRLVRPRLWWRGGLPLNRRWGPGRWASVAPAVGLPPALLLLLLLPIPPWPLLPFGSGRFLRDDTIT